MNRNVISLCPNFHFPILEETWLWRFNHWLIILCSLKFYISDNGKWMTISYKILKVLWILQESMHVWYNKLRYLISNFKSIWIRTNGIIMVNENMSDNKWRYISYLRREPKSNIFTRNINMCVPDKFFSQGLRMRTWPRSKK